MLMKFQNVLYNVHNIFIKDSYYKCSNTFEHGMIHYTYTSNLFLHNLNLHLFIFHLTNFKFAYWTSLECSGFSYSDFPFLIYLSAHTYSKKDKRLLLEETLRPVSQQETWCFSSETLGEEGGDVKRLELRNCSRKYALPVPGVSTAFRQGNERARDWSLCSLSLSLSLCRLATTPWRLASLIEAH